MKTQIEKILLKVLPENAYRQVIERTNSIDRSKEIKILIAASPHEINSVRGQHPQLVSLILRVDNMSLYPQVFGCNGGQHIYRKPNMDHPKEKYLAMQRIKIPFRKPKPEAKFVLNAIEKFASNWVKLLKENKEVLMYDDIVDYDNLI